MGDHVAKWTNTISKKGFEGHPLVVVRGRKHWKIFYKGHYIKGIPITTGDRGKVLLNLKSQLRQAIKQHEHRKGTGTGCET